MGDETGGKETLAELLDAALNALDEGAAVLDSEARVVAWNPAAEAASGYLRADLLGRCLPDGFYQPDLRAQHHAHTPHTVVSVERPVAVKLRHSRGHTLSAMLRLTPLRNALGRRAGTLLRFHPTEEADALPHGATGEDEVPEPHVEHNQEGLEERLKEASRECLNENTPFGLLWIAVDQAEMLRKTHGRDAFEAMLAVVERTLAHALRSTEIFGRWGSHEFLVLCHEPSADLLLLRGRHVCDLARSADFRWWGDRVPITVSTGAAQAQHGEKLSALLLRAQHGMERSRIDGGNTVVMQQPETTFDHGREACSQS